MNHKIINYAPTGTQTTRENSLAPLSYSEIVEDVHEAYEVGITVVHVHARDENLNNTYRRDIYQKIIEGIKKHCPNLSVCFSLTGRNFPEFEQRSECLDLYPDMGSLTMSSLNFTSKESINSPDTIIKLIEKMKKYGVIPEIECFDSGMLNYTKYLIQKGILEPPYYINVVFGNIANAQVIPTSVSDVLNHIPEGVKACFGGIGKQQLFANILGFMYADGIRIGLEDNLYFRDKEKAKNIDLLKRSHNLMNEMGFKLLSHMEFQNLGYANKIFNNTGIQRSDT